MKNKILKISIPFLLLLALLSLGWGSTGHRIISGNIILSLPDELSFLTDWQDSLAAHASDADKRKGSDPDEGPKHYIDIDNYNDFILNGTILQNFDSLVAQNGYSFVLDQGILPWAIITAYDSLKNCFERKDWHKAMLFASDLGHYVADGHMPLHITRNYNGQYSNQNGIHSRYESQMINSYSSQINYAGGDVDTIENISNYVFDFIYNNYNYVDSVLAADNFAKSFSGGSYSSLYYQKMWEYSSSFTIDLFRRASLTLTSIIYKAWKEAGSPTVTNINEENIIAENFSLYQNYPNPFNPSTIIEYALPNNSRMKLELYSATGELVAVLSEGEMPAGYYTYEFKSGKYNLSSGVYFYRLSAVENGTEKLYTSIKKMIMLK